MSFRDRGPDTEREQTALALLRSARELRGLSPVQVRRVEERLRSPLKRERRMGLRLAAASLAVAVMAVGTLAFAKVGLWRLPLVSSLFSATGISSVDKSRRRAPSTAPAQVTPEAERPAGPSPTLAPATHPAPQPADLPIRRKAAVVLGPRPSVEPSRTAARENRPEEDPMVAEGRSLAAAIGKWHRDRDAAAALALLEGHERRFPAGRFGPEVGLLRAEILLHEGREQEGLRLLDAIPLAGLPRARELLTVRGELRMKFGLCQEGRRDLESVLAKDATDGFAERASRAIRLCP
jgi:hypothetical protein